MPGRRRGFALKFLARAALLYPALYVAWLPIQGAAIRVCSAIAEKVLLLAGNPPLITSLSASGNIVEIRSFVTGVDRPMATWNGGDLHIFVVAALTLGLAVPSLAWAARVRLLVSSFVLIGLVCVGIVLVQAHSVAESFSVSQLGLTLHTAGEKTIMDWSNRALIFVGMLLLPSVVFFLSYFSSLASTPQAEQKVPAERGPRSGARRVGLQLRAVVLFVGLFACIAVGIILAAERPKMDADAYREGWRQILELNPSSALAQLNLGVQEEEAGELDSALALYQGAVRSDASLAQAHLNLGNALYKKTRYADAERSFHEVLVRSPENASAEKNLGATLIRLGRECEALPHLQRSMALDAAKRNDPALQREVSSLERACQTP